MKTVLAVIVLGLCLVGCGKKEPLTLEQKAAAGDAKAQYDLARMYELGEGVPKDDKEAMKWYRKAAEQGVAKAQHNLGLKYELGEGVPKDDKEAMKWFRKAAEQGHALAQAVLGASFFDGLGVLEDYATAYAWMNIAAANGNAKAKKNKGIIAKKMTPDQIAKGEALAKEMIKKNPKLLKKK